jgi:hypothetical protein
MTGSRSRGRKSWAKGRQKQDCAIYSFRTLLRLMGLDIARFDFRSRSNHPANEISFNQMYDALYEILPLHRCIESNKIRTPWSTDYATREKGQPCRVICIGNTCKFPGGHIRWTDVFSASPNFMILPGRLRALPRVEMKEAVPGW